jgi:rare lipoprotein A
MNDRNARNARPQRRRTRGRSLLALAVMALALPFGARAGIQEGTISWYGSQFHDRPTASGELFDKRDLTMAHPTLPFGTRVLVTNLRNGRSVVVRVNDRGPFIGHRIADLSQAAASLLGMIGKGVAKARIEVLGDDEYTARN